MSKERKQMMWSRQRIEQLIDLYKNHECLWNPWNESYKNKAKRNRAVEAICNLLDVSKPEFAKKIHNLRNQFNTELKKYEQLLQEAEEEDGNKSNNYCCRWVHFQPLMFLKNVIAPRPGIHPQQTKRTKVESNIKTSPSALLSDDICIEETQIGEVDDDSNDVAFDGLEEEFVAANDSSKSLKEEKRNVITLTNSKGSPTKYFTRLHASDPLMKPLPNPEVKTTGPQSIVEGTFIEFNSSSALNTLTEKQTTTLSNKDSKIDEVRDQWTAFGEFVANELRNYHSELSRRKLKRKIMQAMLEIGEEDDELTTLSSAI